MVVSCILIVCCQVNEGSFLISGITVLNSLQKLCADIISVLAMTSDDRNDCINYRMMGKHEPIGDWGHEYVR